jgi:hypothetical protein
MEEHTINGKKVAFNPRELDEGGVANIAKRIRANGFDITTFTPTGIIKVSVQTQLFLRHLSRSLHCLMTVDSLTIELI